MSSDPGQQRANWARAALHGIMLAASAGLAAAFVYVIVQRFRFPVELEWMIGSVYEHVERVMNGQPVYSEPSEAWIPFLYPPLYYWVSAVVAKAFGVVRACQLVSVTAALVTAACVYRVSRALDTSRSWSAAGVGLFFGSYSFTGYWYDLPRSDMLFTALILGATLLVLTRRGTAAAAVAGATVGLAFFAKQPALTFLVGGAVGLALARERRRAIAWSVGGLAVIAPLFLWLNASTGGWFRYYCMTMPAAHGFYAPFVSLFWIVDLSNGFALTGATAAAIVVGCRAILRGRRGGPAPEPRLTVFVSLLVAALAASALSRMHLGGWLNVLIFWSTFASVAFVVLAHRFERSAAGTERAWAATAVVCGLVVLQLARFAYDPGEPSPNARRVQDQQLFVDYVRHLEKSGDVVVHGRGHVTARTHFHVVALMDVLRAGRQLPDDLVQALEQRKYAAYVVNEWSELTLEVILGGRRSDLFEHVMRNYFVAVRLDDREPPPVTGWWAHPSWVLRPRTVPLKEATVQELERRQRIEISVVEMRMRAVQAGVRPFDDGLDVEAVAAELDSAAPHKP